MQISLHRATATGRNNPFSMQFSTPLKPAVLLKRYQRFLADVQFADGQRITAHCPNTGSMLTCSTPGSRVYLSRSDNTARKYPYTLELVEENGTLIGINTSRTNSVVQEAIRNGVIGELNKPTEIQKEVKTSDGCRLDLALHFGSSLTYVEIKSCTFVQNGIAMFPDAVTTRGHKHLLELADLVDRGHGGAVFFLVQRSDARHFRPASHIDPLYSATLKKVHERGVAILVYQTDVTPEAILVSNPLPFSFS